MPMEKFIERRKNHNDDWINLNSVNELDNNYNHSNYGENNFFAKYEKENSHLEDTFEEKKHESYKLDDPFSFNDNYCR